MQHPSVLAVLTATATFGAAASAAAAPVTTNWSGWENAAPVGVPSVGQLAVSPTRTVVVGRSDNGRSAFVVRDASQVLRLGIVQTDDGQNQLRLRILGDDHYLLAPECGLDQGATRAIETTDGGASWGTAPTGSCVAQPTPANLRATPLTNEQVDGVATQTGGIERSDDGGATWTSVPFPGPDVDADGAPVPVTRVPGGVPQIVDAGDGRAVAPVAGALLVTTDGGRTFARRTLPAIPGYELAKLRPRIVLCRTDGTCLVEVARPDGSAPVDLRFDGTTFGPQQPAAPASVVPSGGEGLVGLDGGRGLVRSADFGATFETVAAPLRPGRRNVGTHGLLALAGPLGLSVAATAEDPTWKELPLPEQQVLQVAGTPDQPYALVDGGRILRFSGGAWAPVADVSAVAPSTLAVSSSGPVVAGRRGVARVTGGRVVVADSPALAGRALTGLSARGRLVFAWGRTAVARSRDGGATWSSVRVPATPVVDVQVLGTTSAIALGPDGLYRTTDAGGRFTRGAALPSIETLFYYGQNDPRIEFTTPRRGIVVTRDAVFRTGDGGATATLVPTPERARPTLAVPYRDGLLYEDPVLGLPLRNGTLLTGPKPSMTLLRAGKVLRTTSGREKARTTRRSVTVVGRLRGAPVASRVVLFETLRGGTYGNQRASVSTNADGTFRRKIALTDDRALGVKAFYAGSVDATRSTRSTTSPTLRIR
ncbi:WD40/YVTN/BNR-like repeat-containing protein [Patulibacter minatonensis]|uniref:WD40/YVTN/BNR-like repeat-containing protein n=1 Tax=Patulibacter minatonensis TaxID=298163 RepID=UPI0004794B16|nr:hypothetical protein [Patulibacter minatonensis]